MQKMEATKDKVLKQIKDLPDDTIFRVHIEPPTTKVDGWVGIFVDVPREES